MAFDWSAHPVTVVDQVAGARIQAIDDALVAVSGAASGRVVRTATAASALSGQRAVTPTTAGTVRYADASTLDDSAAPLWLTTGAAAAGAPVDVVLYGALTEPSWSWTRGPVWLSTSGQLTQIPPTTPGAAFSAVVGYATSPTSVLVDRQPSFVLN